MIEKNLKRVITHEGYGKATDNLDSYYHKVNILIYEIPGDLTKEEVDKGGVFNHASDRFLIGADGSNVLPIVIGGISLLFIVPQLIFLKIISYAMLLTGIFFLLLSIVYYFTKPKKEFILNRLEGLVTIPGLFYQKNITMSFDKMIFCYSTGGEDGIGAFQLDVIRPSNYTFATFCAGASDCYEDMSFFTWYMDKNRPLPPGTAFDKYRQQDFERRKAEGFPMPLYPNKVKTPEATKEQQAERKRIGGW